MFDLLNKLFDRHTWINLFVTVSIILVFCLGILGLTIKFPIAFSIKNTSIENSVYHSHDKTYAIHTQIINNQMKVFVSITDVVNVEAKDNVKSETTTNTATTAT